MPRQLQREDYTVGWVCALPIEFAAAEEMLDERHESLKRYENDENLYSLGAIAGHNVVIACLPAGRIGTNSAATVATRMRATFKRITFGLLVGIGGGVPSAAADIRLGDVVVSQPTQTFGGVIQYDIGKTTSSGFVRTGSMNSPPLLLLNALSQVQANGVRDRSKLVEYMAKLDHLPKFRRESAGPDLLFQATYNHVEGSTCHTCDPCKQVVRHPREPERDVVHYGIIASGNQVMRDGVMRDTLSEELGGVLCFEMEAAGLLNHFPCLVIRGICDYADSHKNKSWQAFAAGTAAAFAAEVLSVIPLEEESLEDTREQASLYIPFPRNSSFVGRSAELNELREKLIVNRDCRRISIVGLGGVGKTQIALQFIYLVREVSPAWSIFWIPALSLESFEQACAEIARKLQIPQAQDGNEDVKEVVKQYLSGKGAKKWLLVVDNADDMEVLFGKGQSRGIADYLPDNEDGLVVFTTRNQEAAVSLTQGNIIALQEMTQHEALYLLKKLLIKTDMLRNSELTSKLLDELMYLPLAVVQAAAYLNRNKIQISEYLRLLRNTEQDMISLMSREFRDNTRYNNSTNAVLTTWVLSFNQILKQDPIAADILSFMSCIEWKAIPHSILPPVQPAEQMTHAIGTLCAYSFASRRDNESVYDLHRLVHLATRLWIRQHGSTAEVMGKAVARLAEVFPSSTYENRPVWSTYLPHAVRLLENTSSCNTEEKYKLCRLVGKCLEVDGRAGEALIWFKKCYEWRITTLDEANPKRLYSQHDLARAYRLDGHASNAIGLLEHAIAVWKTIPAQNDLYQLDLQHELATAWYADGQVKKAIKLLEHIVATGRKLLMQDHPNQVASEQKLAMAYLADGQVKKAVEMLEYVTAIKKKNLQEDHPYRLASEHILAQAYLADGQVKKAVEMLEYVIAVGKATLQNDHPDQLASEHELASAYLADGQVKKAIELLEHIVAIQKVLQEDHPHRLDSERVLSRA